MSQTLRFRLAAVSMFICLVAAIAVAVPFDPVFRVLRIKGICQVALPDSSDFVPVKPGKAYPLGSTIRTGAMESEAIVAFCDNHECKMAANTTARFTDEAQDRENRTVHLVAGRVDVELDAKPQALLKFTNRVFVQTAVGIAAGEKSRFSVTVSRNNEIHESFFECGAGMIGVSGSQFQAPVVKEGASLKVTGPTDQSWVRVQTVKGEIPYDLRNDSAEPISHPTKAGAVIKITQRVAETTKTRHVVLWTLKPDGTTETNYTYKVPPQAVGDGNAPAAKAADNQQVPQQGI